MIGYAQLLSAGIANMDLCSVDHFMPPLCLLMTMQAELPGSLHLRKALQCKALAA